MKKLAFLLIAIILFLPSCQRVTEVDGKSFVTAIGFDKGENYNLRFTFVFTSPSKSSNNASGKEEDETIVIEAPSLYSAIEQINNFKSKTIELTHTQTVIFSEELAKEGLEEYIYMLVRSSHFRPNTYLCIADRSSMEFLERINPVQTYHLEKYFQLIFNKLTSGKKGDLYLYDAYFRLLSESRTGILPYCAINDTELKTYDGPEAPSEVAEKPSEEPSEGDTLSGHFSENTDDYAVNIIAGKTISQSDNTAEIQGVGVIKDGVLVTVLGRMETISLQMLTNSLPNTYLTLSNPYSPDKMITCYISAHDSKISVDCERSPVINIDIELEGDFAEVGADDYFIQHPSEFEEYFEEKTKETIKKFLDKTIRLNCDICGFSDIAKSEFLTVNEFEAYNWNERFKAAEYNLNVNLTMRTFGELSRNGVK